MSGCKTLRTEISEVGILEPALSLGAAGPILSLHASSSSKARASFQLQVLEQVVTSLLLDCPVTSGSKLLPCLLNRFLLASQL